MTNLAIVYLRDRNYDLSTTDVQKFRAFLATLALTIHILDAGGIFSHSKNRPHALTLSSSMWRATRLC